MSDECSRTSDATGGRAAGTGVMSAAVRTTGNAVLVMVAGAVVLTAPDAATAQALQSGAWNVTSTVASIEVPGMPGFMQRMARGRSKAEHKRLGSGQGMEALLAPDPKAGCRVDGQRISDGRYDQTLTCPQKRGGALHIVRAGSYDGSGFAGRATIDGSTPRGPLHIVLDQLAARVGG